MKKLIASLTGFFAIVVFAIAGDAAADLEKFQGNWTVVSLVEKGKALPDKELEILEVSVEKDVLTVKEKGKVEAQYQIKLDPTKTPRTIDFTNLIGKSKGEKEQGIYSIDGTQLKLAIDEERKGRPTTFDGKETLGYSVMTLKRK